MAELAFNEYTLLIDLHIVGVTLKEGETVWVQTLNNTVVQFKYSAIVLFGTTITIFYNNLLINIPKYYIKI